MKSVKLHHRHVHPPSVRRSGLILVGELLEEATLSGRLCERKDDGTAWSWNPRLLIGGMTERGTTGAGEPQITGVPRVHRTLGLHGCGTMEENIRFGYNGICPLTSLATIHGSPVMNGAKLSHHGTKSRLGGRLACWTPNEGETEEPFRVGRWIQPKGPDEPQAAVEEVKVIPRASALQEVFPSHGKQPRTNSAPGMEDRKEMRLPMMNVRPSTRKRPALVTSVKQRRAGKPQSSGGPEAKLDKLTQKLSKVRDVDDWVIGKTTTLPWSE